MDAGFLPYGRQTIGDDDVAAVVAALRADMLTTGPLVEAYEAAFANSTSAPHAVACNSGTAALHLAVLSSDLSPSDAAIVPSITFLATANVVRMTGAEVVFADVDPDTGLMTVETFEEALRRVPAGLKVKLALPVHVNGQLCDMPALAAYAISRGVSLIEDACHALGVKDVGAAAHSQAACFSTHPVKAIATGEGGVVTTRDAAGAVRMRQLRSHGMMRPVATSENVPAPWIYEMHEVGWNYRLPDILCALGISQLGKLEGFHRRRAEIAALYDSLLAPLAPVLRPVARRRTGHGWHLYPVLVDYAAFGTTRQKFVTALREQGIGTQVHYIPVHTQPYYRARYGSFMLPGAEAYYARCLSIPFFPALTDDQVRRVASALSALVKGA